VQAGDESLLLLLLLVQATVPPLLSLLLLLMRPQAKLDETSPTSIRLQRMTYYSLPACSTGGGGGVPTESTNTR